MWSYLLFVFKKREREEVRKEENRKKEGVCLPTMLLKRKQLNHAKVECI